MGSGNMSGKRSSKAMKRAIVTTKIATATRKSKAAKLTAVLAAFVTLCTAWALMVPALSITNDNARPEEGFFNGEQCQ